MKFEDYNISPEIKRNLSELGFKRPTDIQFKSIPPILRGEDVLAIAQTGTGKTAAYAIPVIELLHDKKSSKRTDGIRCLVMVPTHELALQVKEAFENIGRHTRVNVFSVFGGVEQGPQIAKLEKGIDILIATPGRLFDLASQGFLKLNKIEILILDEADHMLDLGFIGDIRDLMKILHPNRQTLFFSATINEKIKKLAYSLIHTKAIRIQISPDDRVAANIHHMVAFIGMDDKRFFLERLIKDHPENKIIVFVRTKVRAERVSAAMDRAGINSITIHSDKEQKDRQKVMTLFRAGEIKLLIATDISARGIDIPYVDIVVNYDLPEVAENYVHRVGRTGRGTQKGEAISFCSPEEIETLKEIEGFLGKPIEVVEIKKTDYEATIAFSDAGKVDDWQKLMREEEERKLNKKRKKK